MGYRSKKLISKFFTSIVCEDKPVVVILKGACIISLVLLVLKASGYAISWWWVAIPLLAVGIVFLVSMCLVFLILSKIK